MQLTKNFKLSEFDCKDGTAVPKELIKNVQELADNLQIIRDRFVKELEFETPLKITSGYRTVAYNKKKKGATNSMHVQGKASDIVLNDPKLLQHLYILINELIDVGDIKAGGCAYYKVTDKRKTPFIHYDIRGVKAKWKT